MNRQAIRPRYLPGISVRIVLPSGLLSAWLMLTMALPATAFSQTEHADEDFHLGVIVDETISAFGHEFVRQLSAKWLLDGSELRSSLAIKERPSPLKGSLIEIHYENKPVYVKRYPARRADIDKFASEAIPALQQKILEAQLSAITASPDLAGTGF